MRSMVLHRPVELARLIRSLRADRAGVFESYVAGLIHDVLVAKYKYLNRRRSLVKV
jgi:hypothetical protein